MARYLGPVAGPIGRATGCALKLRHSRIRRTSLPFHQACYVPGGSFALAQCFVFPPMRISDKQLAQAPPIEGYVVVQLRRERGGGPRPKGWTHGVRVATRGKIAQRHVLASVRR